MRTVKPALAVLLAAALAAPATAGAAAPPHVTVSVISAPLPAVLQAVARAAGAGITVDPTVPETPATVHFRNTPLAAAWAVLEQAYGLVIREVSPRTYLASKVTAGSVTLRPTGWDGTVVRVYRLQHAPAEQVAEALATLFGAGGARQAPQQAPQQQPQQQAPQQGPEQQTQPASPQGPGQPPAPVAIAAVPETNQLVVRAPAHISFMIAAAIRQLDVQAGQAPRPEAQPRRRAASGPTTESYTLRYAKPSAVAKVVSEQVQGVKVSADDTQNALVVTATAAEHDRVRAILETLDRPLSQLVVEAEVFTVQDSVQKTLGIEWSLDAVYTISQAPGKLDPFQIVARLQAAAQSGRARVLSRPRVLTVSGEQATITVGDQIPVLGRDQQGNTIVIQTVNAGMRLQVTPRILPDGNVELQLAAEANSLSGFVGNFPIISQRSVQTRLSVRDGTPVIIGGLIGENKSTSTVKLPFLGDLPILGALFRTTTDRAERVELVIVVTPRVVSTGPITRP